MTADADRLAPPELDPEAPKKRGGGPQTPEGRDRSKRNSAKHGLAAESVFPEELALAIAARTDELTRQFAPKSPYETSLVGEIAKAMAKLDRCAQMTILDLQRTRDLANPASWEAGRTTRAEALGKRLPKDPS